MTSLTASDPPCKLALATNLDLIRCEKHLEQMVLHSVGILKWVSKKEPPWTVPPRQFTLHT